MSISGFPSRYMDNFPTQLPQKAAQGFVASTVIHLAMEHTVEAALFSGGLAVLASTIEAATRPILKEIFPDIDLMVIFASVAIVNLSVTSFALATAPALGITYEAANLLLEVIAWLALNHGAYHDNVAFAEIL